MTCPFCGVSLSGLRASPGTTRKITRAAALAFSAALGASALAGCLDTGRAVPAYGGPGIDQPRPDAGADSLDAGSDSGKDGGTDAATESGTDSGVTTDAAASSDAADGG